MFSNYFKEQAEALEKALVRNMRRRSSRSTAKSSTAKKGKDLRLYREFYQFLQQHLPQKFSLAVGKVRNKNHILNRNCDLLIYRKWCADYMQITSDYVLSDDLHAAISLESELSVPHLSSHAAMTRAVKTICSRDESKSESRPVTTYSILFAYNAKHRLKTLKENLERILEDKEIELNRQPDMICLLNQGLLIKDWEIGGRYKGIKTNEDTLLWFYILLLEYLDRDEQLNINLRKYIKGVKEYVEY